MLEQVLSAAQMAPTWKNTQTPGYIVIESSEMKQKLMEALPSYNVRNVSTAPVVIVMTTKKKRCAYERDGSFSTKKEDRWEMFGRRHCLPDPVPCSMGRGTWYLHHGHL